MKYLGLLILSTAFLFLACKKEEPEPDFGGGYWNTNCETRFYFQGIVVDSLSGLPIENAMIFHGDSNLEGTDTTDTYGNFLAHIKFFPCGKPFSSSSQVRPTSVGVYLSGYGNYHGRTTYSMEGVADNDTVKNCLIKAVPYSWVNIHVVASTGGQEIWLRTTPWTENGYFNIGSAAEIDTFFLCKVYSNRTTTHCLESHSPFTTYSPTYYYAGYGVTGDTIEIHYP